MLAELAKTLFIQYKQGQEILTYISGKLANQAGFIESAKRILSPDTGPPPDVPSTDINPDLDIEQNNSPFTSPPPSEEPAPRSSSSGSSFFCFISSSIFGENSKETIILRKFRDNHLLQFNLGEKLVQTYYITSPDIITINNKLPIMNEILKFYLTEFIDLIE